MRPSTLAPLAALLVPLLSPGGMIPGRAPDGPTGIPAPEIRTAVPAPLAIVGVTVVDVREGRLLPDRTVVIDDGWIAAVEAGGEAPEGARVIDGSGKYLIPGLIDAHAHLNHPAAPEVLMPQFVAHGVTGVREMASDCEKPDMSSECVDRMKAWRDEIEAGRLLGPRLLVLSSFPLNPPWDYELSEEEARGVVALLDERGIDLVKTYFRLSPEAFGWVVDEARKRGLDAAGHIPLRMTSEAASEAGLRSLEHARDFLFDCFPGSDAFRATTKTQNPPIEVMRSMVEDHDEARCAEIFATFVENDTWYVPTHVTRRMDAYADDPGFRDDPRRKYLPAAVWKEWQEDADGMVALDPSPEGRRVMRGFFEKGLEITGAAHEAGVKIALGTDAGDTYVFPGSGAHDELALLVEAGLTPAEALAAGTLRAAELLRVDDQLGAVEPGKRADLVLLGADPLEDVDNVRAIETVFLGGTAYDRTDLDGMLEAVEETVAEMESPE